MIPLLRTTRPESAANLLLAYFRNVLVHAHYDNLDTRRIRFRADLVTDERVFFGKVPSQIKKWRDRGGLLISWRRTDEREGPHDAILFQECPKSIEGIYRGAVLTRHVAVIYDPPTWRAHEETIAKRHKDAHPSKHARQVKRLMIVRDYVAGMTTLSRTYLARRLPALAASLPPSCAPVSPAAAAHSRGTTG